MKELTLSKLHQLLSMLSLDASNVQDLVDLARYIYLDERTPGLEHGMDKLRELLRMPPHPKIIKRPWYLITRRVPGLQEPVLCGFVLEYHSGGFLLESHFKLYGGQTTENGHQDEVDFAR